MNEINMREFRLTALESERKKWEFRYENQDKRIKELELTVKKLRAKIKELKRRDAEDE